MTVPLRPRAALATHEVFNMPPHLGDRDLWTQDTALREGVRREGAAWAEERIAAFGRLVGRAEVTEKAEQANRHGPELKPFDRYGMRIDRVEYHPAYHDLVALAVENEVASFAWNHAGPGAHVGHMALTYLFSQMEGGAMCPMAMTYAAIPALNASPEIAEAWIPRLLSNRYDGRDVPVEQKPGATIGMFMKTSHPRSAFGRRMRGIRGSVNHHAARTCGRIERLSIRFRRGCRSSAAGRGNYPAGLWLVRPGRGCAGGRVCRRPPEFRRVA